MVGLYMAETITFAFFAIIAFFILSIKDLIKHLIQRRRFIKANGARCTEVHRTPFMATISKNLIHISIELALLAIYIIFMLNE